MRKYHMQGLQSFVKVQTNNNCTDKNNKLLRGSQEMQS